jgi:hypothetical protein
MDGFPGKFFFACPTNRLMLSYSCVPTSVKEDPHPPDSAGGNCGNCAVLLPGNRGGQNGLATDHPNTHTQPDIYNQSKPYGDVHIYTNSQRITDGHPDLDTHTDNDRHIHTHTHPIFYINQYRDQYPNADPYSTYP